MSSSRCELGVYRWSNSTTTASMTSCACRKPRLAHYGSRRAHVTCYAASLHLVDFKCASSFGEAHPGNLEQRASLPLEFLDAYSFAASGIPPLLDPHYKLEANDKFRAFHTLAVHHACQRLDAFLWSGNQHMLPRRAD